MSSSLYGLPIPEVLQDVAARHQQHILELVWQLKSVGMDARQIEASVDQLIASYRAELHDAVKEMGYA
jgi:hypothetical protein